MLKKCCIVLPLMILVMIFLGACNNTTNISVDSIGQLHYNYNNEHTKGEGK